MFAADRRSLAKDTIHDRSLRVPRTHFLSILFEHMKSLPICQFTLKIYYSPQTKLWKGNVFTSVCQEFCPRGGEDYTPSKQTSPPLGQTPPGQTHTPQADPSGQTPLTGRHPPSDDHCSGRHASYWDAFLFHKYFYDILKIEMKKNSSMPISPFYSYLS